MTVRQQEILTFINSTIFRVGENTVELSMHLNDVGGWWVDIKSELFTTKSITAITSEWDMLAIFRDVSRSVNLDRSKKNRDLKAAVLDSLLNFGILPASKQEKKMSFPGLY